MVLDYPFVWPLWNAAENSQRQVCKQSLTLSESTTRDGLCLASRTPPAAFAASVLTLLLPRSKFSRAFQELVADIQKLQALFQQVGLGRDRLYVVIHKDAAHLR